MDAQDEVDMIAEEGTHDEREYASGKGENQHVYGRYFILTGKQLKECFFSRFKARGEVT